MHHPHGVLIPFWKICGHVGLASGQVQRAVREASFEGERNIEGERGIGRGEKRKS